MKFESLDAKLVLKGLVIILVLLTFGCGHRASHGVKKHSHKTRFASHQAEGGLDSSKNTRSKSGTPSGLEDYFPKGEGTFADLLDEDTLIQEDPDFSQGGNSGPGSQDYWANRTKAEQLTAQSGLQDVHFAFNSSQLTERAKSVLAVNAEWLKDHPHAEITIEGHCDDRGTSAYNYILGEKRAVRAKNFLASLGVKVEQLQIMSFGKDNPACWDPTEACYQKNRRAHMVLGINLASTAMR